MYYQAYTQVGWYRLNSDHLQDFLVKNKKPSYSYFAPADIPLKFNADAMIDISQWLKENGNNVIYVYGNMDPITACAVEISDKTNAIKIVQQGANHYLKINDLDEKEFLNLQLSR